MYWSSNDPQVTENKIRNIFLPSSQVLKPVPEYMMSLEIATC